MTTIGLSNQTPNITDDAANSGQPSELAANAVGPTGEARGKPSNASIDKASSDKAKKDQSSSQDAGKKRIPLLWIAATLAVGLFIAAIYLGNRIIAAHRSSQQAAAPGQPPKTGTIPVQTSPDSIPPPPPAANSGPVAASTVQLDPVHANTAELGPAEPDAAEPGPLENDPSKNGPDDAIPMIAPHSGERYIQIGALDAAATRRFIRHLRDQNLDPHVAPGPTPELMRVLIGPFDDTAALNERKAQLESQGMDTFVRQY